MNRAAMAMLLAAALAGCTSQPPLQAVPAARQVLVIMSDAAAGPLLPVGSKRGYHDGTRWPASLHVRSDARRLAMDHGLRELHAWPIAELEIFCVVLEVPAALDRQGVVQRLQRDARVEHAQPVNEYQGMLGGSYDDPLFDAQYGEHREALESVHAITTGGGVRVGIVDGPVDGAHADLRGQIVRQVPPAAGADPQMLRHGTAVTGVIAAAAGNGEGVVGLAPDATVSVYAACRHRHGGVSRCTTVSLAEAIEQAIADEADVVNLSLAGPDDWLLERLLRHLHQRGAVLVAAYNAEDPARRFPGSLPFVLAATPDARPWFARHEQFSTRAGGGYQVFFGSSMSAAGVAGMAALLRTRWSAAETEAILTGLLRSGCPTAETGPVWRAVAAHDDCAP